MKRVLACAVVVVLCSFALSAALDVVSVDGGKISGTSNAGVRVFKGIPFAAPPLGELRWRAPQPIVAWSGVKTADTFGPQCMQTP